MQECGFLNIKFDRSGSGSGVQVWARIWLPSSLQDSSESAKPAEFASNFTE